MHKVDDRRDLSTPELRRSDKAQFVRRVRHPPQADSHATNDQHIHRLKYAMPKPERLRRNHSLLVCGVKSMLILV